MTVRVLYFSALREVVGRSEEEIAFSTPASLATLVAALRGISAAHAGALADLTRIRGAINADFARWDAPVADGDEVALFPPVTGGAGRTPVFEARVEEAPFDLAAEHARLAAIGTHVGAIVSFTGLVRDTPLLIEHYPRMAERELGRILQEARARWPLSGAIVIHRTGALPPGAEIVAVLTAAQHRAAAFAAAEFLMDWLKTRAPFWKKERGVWVEAKDSDAVAAARWE